MNKPFEDWTLPDWNRALIFAVFIDNTRSRPTISRIDTTGKLLLQITGASSVESAKKSFVSAFGRNSVAIRSHFKWSTSIQALTARDDIPPTFAALYLTLVAASADDDTYSEGVFRTRFSLLIKNIGGIKDFSDNFNFNDLPRLWNQLADWSRIRAENRGDCKILILPDPQSNTIIGYSKRLAFPAYKDEKSLRQILSTNKLNRTSDFKSVNYAVFARHSIFTDSFKEEVAEFNKLLSKAQYQAAYDSPFWGAVQDITLQDEEENIRKNGKFCLQLDAVDPSSPELYLLIDDTAEKLINSEVKIQLVRKQEKYSFLLRPTDLNTSIPWLVILRSNSLAFSKSKVGKALRSGAIVLFPDVLGRMSTDGDYYEDGAAVFILNAKILPPLVSTFKHLGLTWIEVGSQSALGSWSAFWFERIGRRSLEVISSELPEGTDLLINKGWKPPRPRLSGGSRYQQALFLNPASNPLIWMENAVHGTYQLIGSEKEIIAEGKLKKSEFVFYIPPEALIGLSDLQICRYKLFTSQDGKENVLEVPALSEVLLKNIKPLLSVENWLTDGPDGMLGSLDNYTEQSNQEYSVNNPIRDLTWPISQGETEEFSSCLQADVSEVFCVLDWISEALLLRFQRRSTLPFDELKAHIKMAAEASGIHFETLRKLLFSSNWLRVIEPRTTPYALVAPGERAISYIELDGGIVARISGMLSRHERQDITSTLQPGEYAKLLRSSYFQLSVGCIVLRLNSTVRLEQVISSYNLRLLNIRVKYNPLGGFFYPTSKASWQAEISNGLPVQMWDQNQLDWTVGLQNEVKPGTVFKRVGNQKTSYWIKATSGYLSTNSRTWAFLFGKMVQNEHLATLYKNGNLTWNKGVYSLPNSLCQWWIHSGGGCVAIDSSESLVFLGDSEKSIWDEMLPPYQERGRYTSNRVRALSRRIFALKIRQASQRLQI